MANADRCVCCGEIIPEGRMVCPNCEVGSKAQGKRLIDANDFLNRLNNCVYDLLDTEGELGYSPEIIKAVLGQTNTVDAVEVVHGRWIDNTDERGFLCNAWRKCSVCGGLNYSKRPPYCPNCGAKMDGDGNA